MRWEKTSGWVHPASTTKIRPASIIPILDDAKAVRDDVKEILDVVAKTDIALASGHLHVSETWIVFEEAQRRGVKRLILTHPEDIVDASLNDVRGIAAMGAAVEHSLCMSVHLLTTNLGNITQGIGTGTILSNSSMTPLFSMPLNSLATTLAGIS